MLSPDDMRLDFRAIADDGGGEALAEIFREYWPLYRRWIRRAARSDPQHGRAQLRQHMPELVPLFEALCQRLGGDDELARFLTLYEPPPVVRGCAQLVLDDPHDPRLVRSYDHHPDLFDAVVLKATWGPVATLALADCVWGALDGINAHGCAVALAFGGRNVVGPGFAAPLIVRYLLETCRDVADVRQALARLPVYMPYTFVAVDATGAYTTAYLGPDRPATFVTRPASTNHQGQVEWAGYARQTQTVSRLQRIEELAGASSGIDAVRAAFLRDPLWRHDYERSGGTLYVADYAPKTQTLRLLWPGREERFELAGFAPRRFAIDLPDRPLD